MFWISLLLNCFLFFAIINLGRWVKYRQKEGREPFRPSILFPVALGTVLTLLDGLRLVFLQQLVVFLIAAVLIYKLISVFQGK
ncbi:MAG: hypothetical protein ACM3UW_07670 [Bacillota bacterium]